MIPPGDAFPPKPKVAVFVPVPAIPLFATSRLPPEEKAAPEFIYPFKTPRVVLYQISPTTGLVGS